MISRSSPKARVGIAERSEARSRWENYPEIIRGEN